ncbi:unnamed protein product [Symbiodinium sp. CCMP2456]|nr:unnamed protein product [Symbiodinium sp. CCMP2456]
MSAALQAELAAEVAADAAATIGNISLQEQASIAGQVAASTATQAGMTVEDAAMVAGAAAAAAAATAGLAADKVAEAAFEAAGQVAGDGGLPSQALAQLTSEALIRTYCKLPRTVEELNCIEACASRAQTVVLEPSGMLGCSEHPSIATVSLTFAINFEHRRADFARSLLKGLTEALDASPGHLAVASLQRGSLIAAVAVLAVPGDQSSAYLIRQLEELSLRDSFAGIEAFLAAITTPMNSTTTTTTSSSQASASQSHSATTATTSLLLEVPTNLFSTTDTSLGAEVQILFGAATFLLSAGAVAYWWLRHPKSYTLETLRSRQGTPEPDFDQGVVPCPTSSPAPAEPKLAWASAGTEAEKAAVQEPVLAQATPPKQPRPNTAPALSQRLVHGLTGFLRRSASSPPTVAAAAAAASATESRMPGLYDQRLCETPRRSRAAPGTTTLMALEEAAMKAPPPEGSSQEAVTPFCHGQEDDDSVEADAAKGRSRRSEETLQMLLSSLLNDENPLEERLPEDPAALIQLFGGEVPEIALPPPRGHLPWQPEGDLSELQPKVLSSASLLQ